MHLNNEFSNCIGAFAKETLGIDIETKFNILSMQLITAKTDGTDFAVEQLAELKTFESGYLKAMEKLAELEVKP